VVESTAAAATARFPSSKGEDAELVSCRIILSALTVELPRASSSDPSTPVYAVKVEISSSININDFKDIPKKFGNLAIISSLYEQYKTYKTSSIILKLSAIIEKQLLDLGDSLVTETDDTERTKLDAYYKYLYSIIQNPLV
jgi:hypothetical protein